MLEVYQFCTVFSQYIAKTSCKFYLKADFSKHKVRLIGVSETEVTFAIYICTSLFQAVIKEQLQESHGRCEYAVYVQGAAREASERLPLAKASYL